MLVNQEFNGAGTFIFDVLCSKNSGFTHGRTQLIRHERRRGLFGQFLMAALNGAITLTQVHSFAVAIPNDLDFNVTRLLNELLHVHGVIAKGSLSLLSGIFPGLGHL